MSGKKKTSPQGKNATPHKATHTPEIKKRTPLRLPVFPLFFAAVWAWTTIYYGTVLQVCREYSFWSTDSRLLEFIMVQPMSQLRYVGRLLLQAYHTPWLGGLLLTLMLCAVSLMVGYVLRLKSKYRALQYVPALAYMAGLTYAGLDSFFEAETGYVMGIPLVALVVMSVLTVITALAVRKPLSIQALTSKDESPKQNYLQTALLAMTFAAIIGYGEWQRPYVRVICKLIALEQENDWVKMKEVARDHASLSNRPMAGFYAIALLHLDELGYRTYDIRLDYDSLHIHGMDGISNTAVNLYVPECSFHAGLVLTAYHNCMEQMVMTGPTVRLLKLMTRCALARHEWELAEKYLRILKDVPFEGEFYRHHLAMVNNMEAVSQDPVIAKLRLTEPIRDSFESQYQQPVFMGYNLGLTEARSVNALHHSLLVCLYTKLLPQFTARLNMLMGSSLPDVIADGVVLASRNYPELLDKFPGLDIRITRINAFLNATQKYMSDRPGNAEMLFDKYKGFYPYYYYFGNLKATKQGYTGSTTSSSGVN